MRDFDKVDRALEMQVIDWLQWADFADDIRKGHGDADKATLTLQLIAKRKAANADLERRLALTVGCLEYIATSAPVSSSEVDWALQAFDYQAPARACLAQLKGGKVGG